MKTNIKEEMGLKRKVEFIVPLDEVQKSFSENFQKIQKKTKIQGFREGKAPIQAIKQNYYKKAWEAVMDDLFKNFYPKAIHENKLNPVSQPTLIDITLEEEKPCTFLVEIEIHPKIEVKNYLNLKIKKTDTKVTDENVSQSLEKLRDSLATYKDSLEVRPVKKDDQVLVSLDGSLNSKNIKELTHKELLLKLGEDKLAPDFDKHLMGLNVGEEKAFDFHFPKNHFYTHIADQTVSLKVKTLSLKEKEAPDLNDDFAKKFKIETLEELKNQIRKDLEKTSEQKAKESMENEIITKLVESNPVIDVPKSLIENQKKTLIENAKKRLKEYGMKAHEEEAWIKEQDAVFEKEAKFSIQSSYLIEKLIEDLKLQLNKEDIEKSLKESFPTKKVDEMEKELKKHNYWNNFIFNLGRQKAISFLLEKADLSKSP